MWQRIGYAVYHYPVPVLAAVGLASGSPRSDTDHTYCDAGHRRCTGRVRYCARHVAR